MLESCSPLSENALKLRVLTRLLDGDRNIKIFELQEEALEGFRSNLEELLGLCSSEDIIAALDGNRPFGIAVDRAGEYLEVMLADRDQDYIIGMYNKSNHPRIRLACLKALEVSLHGQMVELSGINASDADVSDLFSEVSQHQVFLSYFDGQAQFEPMMPEEIMVAGRVLLKQKKLAHHLGVKLEDAIFMHYILTDLENFVGFLKTGTETIPDRILHSVDLALNYFSTPNIFDPSDDEDDLTRLEGQILSTLTDLAALGYLPASRAFSVRVNSDENSASRAINDFNKLVSADPVDQDKVLSWAEGIASIESEEAQCVLLNAIASSRLYPEKVFGILVFMMNSPFHQSAAVDVAIDHVVRNTNYAQEAADSLDSIDVGCYKERFLRALSECKGRNDLSSLVAALGGGSLPVGLGVITDHLIN